MINITDLNGNNIEVADLDEAILITGDRKDYRHVNKGYEQFDNKQSAYWTDLYEKLLQVKKSQIMKFNS
ncbi:hypothetical protein SF1_18410 [Sphingobacterium faecium NBRC 15299]|uniref:hypothetical protein n=1 Tax=Sphingobacterium faecium TaxID=34087 RepID=UPI000D383060|nr:hypothetical protein [Sphingobacterium faecium]PTX09520.1 hypothetical protein C8N37_106148 [Sphingobacterium faecium]GEM63859.1 hypothetical protein SF1_18410 [Sphingobacterium faecium NBRC 15299]